VRRLYGSLEYERALEQLSRAKLFVRSEADHIDLLLYEGVILADHGKEDAANAAFTAALFLRPEAKLPLLVSPKVARRFEKLRQQVKRELDAAVKSRGAASPPKAVAETGAQAPTALADGALQAAPAGAARAPTAGTPAAPARQTPPLAGDVWVSPTSGGMPLTSQAATHSGARSRAWLPALVGGGLLVGGGASYLIARGEQSKLRGDGTGLPTLQEVRRSASRGQTYQKVSMGLSAAGVVGLGISAGMYLLGKPTEPKKLAVEMNTDGTSAFVQARWP
jgi:hypothetical protein